jgi:hypothetical protein
MEVQVVGSDLRVNGKVIGKPLVDTCHLLFSNILTLQRDCNIYVAEYKKLWLSIDVGVVIRYWLPNR